MQKIPLNLAEDGMILEKPVVRTDGMVMAGEGLQLTETIIQRLKNAGIENIVVKGRPVPDLENGMDLGAAIEKLDHLFRKYRENPFMWTLRGMVEQYFNNCLEEEDTARQTKNQKQSEQA